MPLLPRPRSAESRHLARRPVRQGRGREHSHRLCRAGRSTARWRMAAGSADRAAHQPAGHRRAAPAGARARASLARGEMAGAGGPASSSLRAGVRVAGRESLAPGGGRAPGRRPRRCGPRSAACARVRAQRCWPGRVRAHERALRRLQLAAEEGKSFGVVFGPRAMPPHPSPAPLRIQLSAGRGRLELQILKRRGGGWAPPLSLALDGGAEKATRRSRAHTHGESLLCRRVCGRSPLTPALSPTLWWRGS